MPPAPRKRAKVPRLAADAPHQGAPSLASLPGFVPRCGGGV